MTKAAGWLATVLLGVSVGLCAWGCAPPPPSEEALLSYLATARYHGPVRRAWPEGQQWLDGVMEAYRAVEGRLGELEALVEPESLWPAGDPRWHDRAALEEQLKAAEIAGPGSEAAKERAEVLAKLAETLEQRPGGLEFATATGPVAFTERAWRALADGRDTLEAQIAELEALVQERRALYEGALNAVEQADAGRPGLHYADAATEQRLGEQHAALQRKYMAIRERELEFVGVRLADLKNQILTVNKAEQRPIYEQVSAEHKYWRDWLQEMRKSLEEQAKTLAGDLRRAEAKAADSAGGPDSGRAAAQLDYLKARVERLKAYREELRGRINSILEQAELQPSTHR